MQLLLPAARPEDTTRCMKTLKAFILMLMLAAFPVIATAHPHVFIDTFLTLEVDDSGLTGIRQHWEFDEMFTRAILGDLGLELDDSAPGWSETLRKGAFANLQHSNYFTIVQSDGWEVAPMPPEEFKASLNEKNHLVYDFLLPVAIPAPAAFRVAVFDKEYYADILLVESEIRVNNTGSLKAEYTIGNEKDLAYWAGFNVPRGIHMQVGTLPASDIPKPVPPSAAAAEDEDTGLFRMAVLQAQQWQKTLKKEITTLGTDIQSNPFGPALWTFLMLSFVYGVVHAIGPGHGKSVVCSYFLARPGDLWLGALMGNAITFVHVGSAVAVVALAYLLLGAGMGGFHEAARIMQPASYGLLILMGLFLAGKAVIDMRRGGIIRDVAEGSSCSAGDVVKSRERTGHVLLISFVTGLIPCPGAAVVLAFAVGLNILWAGLAAMFAMAVGMGLTTTVFAWAAVSARGVTMKVAGRNRTILNWTHVLLSTTGALFIAAFGASMLAASL